MVRMGDKTHFGEPCSVTIDMAGNGTDVLLKLTGFQPVILL